MDSINDIKLTQYSHGSGCGCKIAPKVLNDILHTEIQLPADDNLLVGNDSRDDAAVYDMGNGTAIISTTDFFMPIVDDAFDFGRIASANALSDIYAMGGTPLMAISILGWPVDKIPNLVAQRVLEGSREICREAGITLAGGHSIDSPEPIFGLAVTGSIDKKNLKQNNTAQPGDTLYLTKPLGIGILSTAQKKGFLKKEHLDMASQQMVELNRLGQKLGAIEEVHAITDVTGFGLLGHLTEMCQGSGTRAILFYDHVPQLPDLPWYLENQSIPGGTHRNWNSYGEHIGELTEVQKLILCDPQTSGGLLVSVKDEYADRYYQAAHKSGAGDHAFMPIGKIMDQRDSEPLITIE